MAGRAGGLFLKAIRLMATLATATIGVWLFWSQYSNLARLSWWYDSTQVLQASPSNPDYDLNTLPWHVVHPRVFDVQRGRLTLVTNAEPYAYQVYAIINTHGAKTAGIKFDADLEVGGATIGLLQAGKWIAVNSSQGIGTFSDLNSALLGYNRSLTVMIANNNPGGQSRLIVKSFRVYLRK